MGVAAGASPPLVERDRELAALSTAASSVASAAAPRLVLVTGDGGIGKSRLVAELVESLPEGWSVTRVGGATTEAAWTTPFAGLVDDVPEGGDPGRALAVALAETLRGRRDGAPALLVVDDLQLLDPLASVALRHLLAEARSEPLLVVATYRQGSQRLGSPHARAVTALLRHPSASELRLAPLTPAGVASLAAGLGLDEDGAAELYRRSEGNPFLVEQLAAATASAVPETVGELVEAMLADLPEETRELAEILAVAGAPLNPTVLAGLDPAGVAARALLEAALAVADGPRLRLRHALLAEAIAAGLDPDVRALRHRRLAEQLALDATTTDDVLARHWAEAGDLDRAAPLAIAAADRLHGQGVHASAVDLYRIALACMPDRPGSGGERASLLDRAAAAAAMAGDDAQATQWAGEGRAADHAAGPARTAAATWGNPLFQRLARARVAASDGDEAGPGVGEISARILEAKDHVRRGSYDRGAQLARAAAADARRIGDRVLLADAALLLGYAGDLPAGLELLAAVADEARLAGDVGAATVALGRRSRLHIASGELDPALESNLQSLALAKASEGPEFWGNPQTGTAFIHAMRGELSSAQAMADELLALELPVLTVFAQGVEWLLAIERSDPAGATLGAERVLPVARAFGDEYFLVPMLLLGGRTALLCGDASGAQEMFSEAEDARWSPLHEQAVDILHGQVQAAVALGDEVALARAVEAATALARAVPGPAVQATADYAQGAAHAAAERPDEAAAAFERAALAHVLAGRRTMALDAWVGAATTGRGARATAAAAAALALADTFGLHRPELAHLRESPAPPVAQADPLAALEPRERQIVELAAAGRSNREIGEVVYISEKTVRNLMTGAFAKLGVKRRAQLGTLLPGGGT